jgi:predicted nucleic acid-binding Zn ribbon protein
MPQSELHERRRKKNYAVLGVMLGFIALIFVVTILRM